jgi:hypothetical protein
MGERRTARELALVVLSSFLAFIIPKSQSIRPARLCHAQSKPSVAQLFPEHAIFLAQVRSF